MSSVSTILLRALGVLGRQRWLRRGIRERAIRALASPENQASHPFEVEFFGFRYRGDLKNYVDWNVFFFGSYERELLLLIRDVLSMRRGAVFMDVGANVGHHTLFAARYAAAVHAFEPYAPVRARLVEKIELNALTNVTIHGFGLGDRNEALPFFAPSGPNQGTGSFVESHSVDNVRGDVLNVVKGDEFGASLQRLDLIKIDVEGFEGSVLSGLRDTLRRYRPAVLFEFSDTTRNQVGGKLDGLFPEDYQVYAVATRRIVLGVLEIPGYRLVPVGSGEIPIGELIALPRDLAGGFADGRHSHSAR